MAVDNIKKGSGGIAGLCIGSTEVSKVYLGSTLVYEKGGSRDYSLEYFTVEALSSGNVVLGSTTSAALYYRVNGGSWDAATYDYNGATATVAVTAGDKVEFKGERDEITSQYPSYGNRGLRYTTATFNLYGNLMSLFIGDSFENPDYTSANLSLSSLSVYSFCPANAVDASNLILIPLYAEIHGMTGSTGIEYGRFFRNCTTLTGAPVLSDTTLRSSCYEQMFDGCSILSNVTCLATDISASDCIDKWLNDTAASGTLHCAPTMTSSWIPGTNIPSGWTVQSI